MRHRIELNREYHIERVYNSPLCNPQWECLNKILSLNMKAQGVELLWCWELNLSRILDNVIGSSWQRYCLSFTTPPQPKLLFSPAHVGVKNGMKEQIWCSTFSEHPHHQKLELIKRQTSILKYLKLYSQNSTFNILYLHQMCCCC